MGKNPKCRQSNLVVQELENELLVYDLHINKIFCLNETAKLVFQLCDGRRGVSEISRSLSQKLKTTVSEDFVWLALDNLNQQNLLDKNAEFKIELAGLNRRQVIRKIGLSSVVAFPLIHSIVAPKAVMAQSGCTTCRAQLANCGTIPDGCGNTLECGGNCPPGQTCGGAGIPNQCGASDCQPRTCSGANAECGTVSDLCDGTLECGTCNPPQTCGGGGVPNRCGGI